MNIKEQVAGVIREGAYTPNDEGETIHENTLADQILSLLKELGYRKVPELMRLSDEEIEEAMKDEEVFTLRFPIVSMPERRIAQAQLDSIKKQIEEANNG